jgi:hypothetical protein
VAPPPELQEPLKTEVRNLLSLMKPAAYCFLVAACLATAASAVAVLDGRAAQTRSKSPRRRLTRARIRPRPSLPRARRAQGGLPARRSRRHPPCRAELPTSAPQWRRRADIPYFHEVCPAPSKLPRKPALTVPTYNPGGYCCIAVNTFVYPGLVCSLLVIQDTRESLPPETTLAILIRSDSVDTLRRRSSEHLA